jgi:hypothetical protein
MQVIALVEGVGKRVLRRIIETKGDEVTGEWRKLHTEDLNGRIY